MLKNTIRQFAQKFGYDFVKTSKFQYGKNYKQNSPDPLLDYYQTPNGNYYFPKNNLADFVASIIGYKFEKLFRK